MDNGTYVTHKGDEYIHFLESRGFNPAPPNYKKVNFKGVEDMGEMHEIIGYLTKCKEGVLEAFRNVSSDVTPGEVTQVDGYAIIKAIWNGTANIDLSIIEPDRKNVNKEFPKGTFGDLWKYDSEESEEIYYIPQETITEGLYQVILSYVEGTEPTEVKIIAKFGTDYYVKEFEFSPENKEKELLLKINVDRIGENGPFEHEFIPVRETSCSEQSL